jgi:iron complex transport system substrate-binding protein
MRIVSLQPSVSIVLDHLGKLDLLVGCTKYCVEALPQLRSREIRVVRDSWSTTMEEITALRPDLVIASVPYRQESMTAILKAGYPVLALAPRSLADIHQDIRLIGAVAGAPEAANQTVANMRAEIDRISRLYTGHDRQLVYCEEWGKPLIHSQHWVRELVEAAGGNFLGEPGATTTAEAIAVSDPEIAIFSWCGARDRVPVDRVVEMRGWQTLRAVRSDRAVCVPDEWLNTPAPTLLKGLDALVGILHPGIDESQTGNH